MAIASIAQAPHAARARTTFEVCQESGLTLKVRLGSTTASVRSLLIYSRHKRLENSGYTAEATPEFDWNMQKARYEPVLRFRTHDGEARQLVLGWYFSYARLPTRDPCRIVYDPQDAAYAEPAYTPGSEPRPPASVVISLVVALFVILLTFPFFYAFGILAQLAIPFVAGCALGAAAARLRTKRRE